MFSDITRDEEEDLRQQFRSEINRVLKTHGKIQVYRLLGVSRETGPKYLVGQIPTKRPKMLRELLTKAIQNLRFTLTYRGVNLTVNLLQPPIDEGERQLELFRQDGFTFEISRRKSAGSVSLEVRIRQA